MHGYYWYDFLGNVGVFLKLVSLYFDFNLRICGGVLLVDYQFVRHI